MPLFASIRKVASSSVNAVFGSNVTWTPAGGGATVAFMGIFKDPTDTYKADRDGNILLQDETPTLLIYIEDCRSLVDLVSDGIPKNSEKVYIDGVSYFIQGVSKLFDGSHISFMIVKE